MTLPQSEAMLTATDIRKRFGAVEVLKGITLTARKGDVISMIGSSGSGKSTILTRVCRGLYEPADVGTLSNNIERKFGLSALAEKLIFIGPEIKSDIALEQAEFQSIVSGETVQVRLAGYMSPSFVFAV
jgi:ABC-type cobalamin/Fe3+-siderophores transport system ATPase subunit